MAHKIISEILKTNQPDNFSEHENAAIAKLSELADSRTFIMQTSEGISFAVALCHGLAKHAGWWTDLHTGQPKDRNDGEMIALMHSELSEALEGLRKNRQDDHLTHRKSVEVELADTLVRIFDYAGARKLDLAGAMMEKLAYNAQRADHKPEARAQADGKKF